MTERHETVSWRDRAGYFLGFALFVPALVLIYLVFAAANWVVFGSLS
jgi:hypothetical protein